MKHEIVDTTQNRGTSEMETIKQVTPFQIPLAEFTGLFAGRRIRNCDSCSDVITI
jgi:hypothetical protein